MSGTSLRQQVNTPSLWPTPTVCGNNNRPGYNAKSGTGLATAARCWPTPLATDAQKCPSGSLSRSVQPDLRWRYDGRERPVIGTPMAADARAVKRSKRFQRSTLNVSEFVEAFPTPKASDHRSGIAERFQGEQSQAGRRSNLNDAVARWPTPTSSLGSKGGRVTARKGREGGNLIEAVSAREQWPTPQARDWKSSAASEATAEKNSRPLNEAAGGPLNPAWVEVLMGWPCGWTSLDRLPFHEWHAWRTGSGRYSVQAWADGSWEYGIPRVVEAGQLSHRVDRITAIGNGQVPLCAATAFTELGTL